MTTTKYMTSDLNENYFNQNNRIKVIWSDTIDNHSAEREKAVKKYFSKKYKTDKVSVIFKAIKQKHTSVEVESTADASEVVLDSAYQKSLIDVYLKENGVSVDLGLLNRLDNSVTDELHDYKEYSGRFKTFSIKSISFSNFLSYGEDNHVKFEDNGGITSVISDPPNFGGKSTLTVDLLLFLFFGSTTKTEKNEEVFNRYTSSNFVEVSGHIEIDGEHYLIKRLITRKEGKDGYTYKTDLEFHMELPNGVFKKLNDSQKKYTEDLIKSYVGTYDDFLITILTTGDNLDSLINTKPTERGRILTKFIGLEFFREKERVAKAMYNDWKGKSKLKFYNRQDILNSTEESTKHAEENELMLNQNLLNLNRLESELSKYALDLENLFSRKINNIDSEYYKINENEIIHGIEKLQNLINGKDLEIKTLLSANVKPVNLYDLDIYGRLKTMLSDLNQKKLNLRVEISTVENKISNLANSEVCGSCKRKLDGIDYTSEINDNKKLLLSLNDDLVKLEAEITSKNSEVENMVKSKSEWDEYNRSQLILEKLTVELNAYKERMDRGYEKLKSYRAFKDAIENNKNIDTEIQKIKFNTEDTKNEINLINLKINSLRSTITNLNQKISDNNTILDKLDKEEIVDKVFRVYLDIYGKNGISKMVLSSMIPLINSYLNILLSDTSEFTLEVRMNEKTEIEFWMVDNQTGVQKPLNAGSGYEKTVSSLALRCVLSKVCSLPKPNIIVFDEITGKVANDNLEKIGLFFEKLKQFFEHIWIISHNPIIQEWADRTILVKKENNISKIN
jgi:DNA repair exonuclease SbcCD ATPase subunit